MRAKLPSGVAERIIEAARAALQNSSNIQGYEIGRLLFTKRCCQTKMVQVKAFCPKDYHFPYSKSNRYRIDDVAVCPICFRAFQLGPPGIE